jgi:hypothetical protein
VEMDRGHSVLLIGVSLPTNSLLGSRDPSRQWKALVDLVADPGQRPRAALPADSRAWINHRPHLR